MEISYTLTGPIDPTTVGAAIVWIQSQIWGGQVSKLVFFISSNGGDVDSAVRLYYYLRSLPVEVETVGFGQVDSAANLVFVASDTRKAVRGCRFLLHEGSFTVGNTPTALHVHEETLMLLRHLLKKTNEIMALETKKKEEEMTEILRQGVIYSDEEAVKNGIATEIVDKIYIPHISMPQFQSVLS